MNAARRAGLILKIRLFAAIAAVMLAAPTAALDLATFNASLNRKGAGVLLKQVRDAKHKQILAVAEIIQQVRPDILLINEIDYDREGLALAAFAGLLGEGERAIDYPHLFTAPSNTGRSPSPSSIRPAGILVGPALP